MKTGTKKWVLELRTWKLKQLGKQNFRRFQFSKLDEYLFLPGGRVHESSRNLAQGARHPGYSGRHSGRGFRQEIQHVDQTLLTFWQNLKILCLSPQ